MKPFLASLRGYLKWWVPLAIRFIFYFTIFTFLLVGNQSGNQYVIGITSGILISDYLTWLMRRFIWMVLDRQFAFETLANIVIAIVGFKYLRISIPTDGDGIALAFVAFMATASLKLSFYILGDINREYG